MTISEIHTSGAEQVAKVLGGTRPSELPVREATRFELQLDCEDDRTHNSALAAAAHEVIE